MTLVTMPVTCSSGPSVLGLKSRLAFLASLAKASAKSAASTVLTAFTTFWPFDASTTGIRTRATLRPSVKHAKNATDMVRFIGDLPDLDFYCDSDYRPKWLTNAILSRLGTYSPTKNGFD